MVVLSSRLLKLKSVFLNLKLVILPLTTLIVSPKFNSKNFKVGVIGLGYVGLPICERFSRVGVEVIGVDNDPNKIKTVIDRWKFTRSMSSMSPNWYLAEIKNS